LRAEDSFEKIRQQRAVWAAGGFETAGAGGVSVGGLQGVGGGGGKDQEE